MIPAVTFGGPENVAGLVQDAKMSLARIDVTLALFVNDDTLLAGAGVNFAQLDGFLPALGGIVRERFAVLVPVEARPALKLHFNRRGLYFDALAALQFENNGLGLWQNFSGQWIYNGVFPRAKLIRRNELQIAEAPGVARVHAVGNEFGGIRRPEHSRALPHVLRSLSYHGSKRRNGCGVVVGAFAIAREAKHFARGEVAQVKVVVFDVSNPLFVRCRYFVFAADGLGTALAVIFFERAGPG